MAEHQVGDISMAKTTPKLAGGWDARVDRGPNWLLVRVRSLHDGPLNDEPLAKWLWHLMEEHSTYRIALELDEIEVLSNVLIRQLARLDQMARKHGGFVRLCGLSRDSWQRVVQNGLGDVFHHYTDREEAVFTFRRPYATRKHS